MTTEVAKKRPATKPGKSPSPHKKPKFDGKPSKFSSKSTGSVGKKPVVASNKFKGKGAPASSAAAAPEKKDWNKFKTEKKELKLKRKKECNNLFELTVEAKKIYEELKCNKTNKNREELATKLFTLLRGGDNFQKLVLAHDTARIVQCLLKFAPLGIRTEISENLIAKVPDMSLSKYAHFCVSRMIKYGTAEIRTSIIAAMYGHVMRMINNKYASTILDTVYVSYASSAEKASLRQEFYGDLYKRSKDTAVKQISDTYAQSPHVKLAIINAVKANLDHVANKKLIDNGLVHAVLHDYLTVCSEEERIEMSVTFNPYIPSLASTKDGSRASMVIFFNSIVKDRRAIVKSLREHLIKLCTHEFGHILILAIINSMDDTKALKKSIFDHIFAQIEFVVANEWGRRVIEWLVSPEDTSLFHPQIIEYLEKGLINSKKDKAVRRAEMLEVVEQPLCKAIADNPSFWLRGGHTGLATAAILRRAKGEHLQEAYDKLAELLVQSDWKVPIKEVGEDEVKPEEKKAAEEAKKKKKINAKILKKYKSPFEKETTVTPPVETIDGIEHAGLHIVLKKLLKTDVERKAENQPTLGAALVQRLTPDVIKRWLPMNRPSFLILVALENGTDETYKTLKAILKTNVALLKKQTHAASKLLVKKLEL